MHKPYTAMFSEFQGRSSQPEECAGSGDVKYHLGTSADREFDGTTIHLSLAANPSHLEAVNPVVLGKVRAKQDQKGDTERSQVMALLMHGDAAFAGQGWWPRASTSRTSSGYRIGGTIHLIVNNQIGFTTQPGYSRSSPLLHRRRQSVQAPIFHVNGDDPEAVVHVSRSRPSTASSSSSDVVIDMVCYRRHGHNESDEPAFTQPLMYQKIAQHPTCGEIYAAPLERGRGRPRRTSGELEADFQGQLEAAHEAATQYKPNKVDWLEGAWTGLGGAGRDERGRHRGRRGAAARGRPDDDRRCRQAARQPQDRAGHRGSAARRSRPARASTGRPPSSSPSAAAGRGLPGPAVAARMSAAAPSSQRHAVLIDQDRGALHPAQPPPPGRRSFEVIDSMLSEEGVLGFEYGY